MNFAFKIIQRNPFFYTLNGLLLFALITISCLFSHSQGFIWLNQIHSKILNLFFEEITFLGDGWFIILLSLYFLLFTKKNKKLTFIILLFFTKFEVISPEGYRSSFKASFIIFLM